MGLHSEVTFREDTGLLKLTLEQDEVPPPLSLSNYHFSSHSLQEHPLPKLGNSFTFPLYISVNMALTSNDQDTADT